MTGRAISHYEVLDKLGEGGMGVVYKARDTRLDRFVALKVLPAGKVSDPDRKRRFVQEAKAASALNHPHIITIYDIDQAEGLDFIAMEFVPGRTLDQLILRKGLSLNDALKYAIQIADALAAAHAAGIVHRDLKPGNVMVNDNGQVKVLDFGLAKLSERGVTTQVDRTETIADRPETEDGVILGTISYMSPEQAEGKKVDSRSDIFSFGSLLYEMVTGRRAFQGDSKLATLSAVLKQDIEPIPAAPRDLEKLLSRCLRKDPERRAQHMGDVRLALEELKEESESGMLAGPARASAKAKRGWLWPLLAALFAISTGVVLYLSRPTDRNDATPLVSVPLTSFPGNEDDPTLSPDGNQVAFMWDGENRDNSDIYVKMIVGGPPLRLTRNPAKDYAPAWSPDGSQIAFLRSEGTADFKESIILISPLGGPERKFTEIMSSIPGSYIAWTPDSKSIAVVDRSSPQEPPSIYLYSLSAGERRRLTTPPAGSFGDLSFAFSRDGKWLAFARYPTSTNSDLLLLPMAPGGEPKRLASGAGAAVAWSPTGEEIIFGRGGLLRLSPFSSNIPPKPIEGAYNGPLTISRSGRMVYVRRSSDSNLWKMQGPGRRPVQVVASTRAEIYPQVSPDGSRIAFSSNRSGASEIWAADSNGSNPIQLTSLKGNSTHSPRWSPDGRSITFSSLSNGNRDIYVMDASGGSLRRLTQEPSEDGRPIWSNDGKSIYFYSNRLGRQEIWKIAPAGGAPVQVTQNGGHELQESPDGAYFYISKGTMTKGLFRRSSAGGEETRILEKAASGWWAVSERGVIFASFDTDGPTSNPPISIQLWDAATGRIATIGTIAKPVQRIGAGLSATRDGQVIVWSQIDQEDSDLMLVDNFR